LTPWQKAQGMPKESVFAHATLMNLGKLLDSKKGVAPSGATSLTTKLVNALPASATFRY